MATLAPDGSARYTFHVEGTADRLLIGGGMLFTFLAAQGHEIGTSLFDAESVEELPSESFDAIVFDNRGMGRFRQAELPFSISDSSAASARWTKDPQVPLSAGISAVSSHLPLT